MSKYKRLPLDDKGTELSWEMPESGPRNLIIVSPPKSGKSLTLKDIPGILIGDLEDGSHLFGSKNIADMRTYPQLGEDGKKLPNFIKLSNGAYIPRGIHETVEDLKLANNMAEYWKIQNKYFLSRDNKQREELGKELQELVRKMKYPILAIDTITSIQEWNNKAALALYNDSVSPDNRKKDIKRVDNYSGVRYTRRNFSLLKSYIEKNAAPHIIWLGHTSARKKVFEKTGEDISVVDIALDGLQSWIFTSESEANAILYRDNKGVWLDFEKKEESDMGTRVPFLAERKIKIAELLSPEELKARKTPKTYWEEIYPNLKDRWNK